MSTVDQIMAVTSFNLRSLRRRVGSSLVIVVGIAGVVAVLISVLAMSAGMMKTLQSSGRADRVVVLRNGSTAEIGSVLQLADIRGIMDAPGIKRSESREAVASAELLRRVSLRKRADNSEVTAVIRGVGPAWSAVRPEIHLIEGRAFRPAINEVIVGKGARRMFNQLQLGSKINTPVATWTVVGVFSSNGDSHESELLTDTTTLVSASGGPPYNSSVTAVLNSADSFQEFKDALSANPSLSVDVLRERDYYERQSKAISRLLSWVAYVVGGVMAIGAFFGATNAMYSAVSTRSRQIATLRALGFESPATVAAILIESLLLSALGGVIGAALAWAFFNGSTVSTGNGLEGNLVFDLSVNATLMVLGISWACVIGLIGGLLPALRAARLPVATALRAT